MVDTLPNNLYTWQDNCSGKELENETHSMCISNSLHKNYNGIATGGLETKFVFLLFIKLKFV